MVNNFSNTIECKGSNFLRQRLILSFLSCRPIIVSDIRINDLDPGLKDYEVNLLRLLDKMSNGMELVINEEGTSFSLNPGLLIGGTFSHDCCKTRGIGYYLEVIFALVPFCKSALDVTLTGITNCEIDVSVDSFKYAGINILKQFRYHYILSTSVNDPDDDTKLAILQRGVQPNGCGKIFFHCKPMRIRSVQTMDCGFVKTIRGVGFCENIAPAFATRTIASAKGRMLEFCPDVYLIKDHRVKTKSEKLLKGGSPGFGICLVASSGNGIIRTVDRVSKPTGGVRQTPEDLAEEACWELIQEIKEGGVIDSKFQMLALILIAFGPRGTSQMVFSPLTPYTITFLQNLRIFTKMTFQLTPYKPREIEEDEDIEAHILSSKVLITGIGLGSNRLYTTAL